MKSIMLRGYVVKTGLERVGWGCVITWALQDSLVCETDLLFLSGNKNTPINGRDVPEKSAAQSTWRPPCHFRALCLLSHGLECFWWLCNLMLPV